MKFLFTEPLPCAILDAAQAGNLELDIKQVFCLLSCSLSCLHVLDR